MAEADQQTVRLTVDEHPSLGLQMSIETDRHGFRIKGPKYAGTSRRLMTAVLDERARSEIAFYIGYRDLLTALRDLVGGDASYHEGTIHLEAGSHSEAIGRVARARAAIAKAEGSL